MTDDLDLDDLNWDLLRFALSVGRAGTLSGAAMFHDVDEAEAPGLLAALEDAFGQPLFDREDDRLVANRAGSEVVQFAERIASVVHGLEEKLAAREADLSGTVKLSGSRSLENTLLSALASLRMAHPQLQVELVTTDRYVDLAAGEADVAVRVRRPDGAGLVGRQVARIGWAFYASPNYLARMGTPETKADLAQHDFVALTENMSGAAGNIFLRDERLEDRIVERREGLFEVRGAISEGRGLGALPAMIGRPDSSLLRVAAEVPLPSSECWLVSHESQSDRAEVIALTDHLTTYLHALSSYLTD